VIIKLIKIFDFNRNYFFLQKIVTTFKTTYTIKLINNWLNNMPTIFIYSAYVIDFWSN